MTARDATFQAEGYFVEIGLSRDELTGQWLAEKLVFDIGELRNRVSFARRLPMERAFTAPFITGLMRFLPEKAERLVHVDSDAMIELPHLMLSGIRVVAHSVVMGMQKVTVRFRRAVGALQSFLRPEHQTAAAPQQIELQRTAADALLTVLQPCLDLAELREDHVLDDRTSAHVAERLKSLSQKQAELSFFAYMLQRYVSRAEPVEAEALPHRADDDPRESPANGTAAPRQVLNAPGRRHWG
ncbi:hypothetical protein [Salipiger mucosus]|uniref:Uncharacterized protein n=1 Tax=Salipiger mucosus DSM 16094 TaxID=1123237 RepID=S9RCN9_9RHOB|nr:hypothetical protein [Salipiger mucosus]EPX75895.1 hypothetical protein Salmuc_00998 [Salipiger mucosus DSM 16094]